jgi:hypothetical protein
MLNIIFLSTLIISLFFIAGIPAAAMTFLNKSNERKMELSVFLAISLILGLGIWVFSASIAYSFFGINSFFVILLLIVTVLWLLLFTKFKSQIHAPIKNNGFVYTVISFFILSLYFAKSQWNANFKPIIHSGIGPDVSQNLLAAFNAKNIGSTWFEASNNLLNKLDATNLNDAALNFFRQPSISDIASYDYLIYGGRWGLTVPYSQIIKLFGPQAVMWEIGTILFVTLFTSLIVIFGATKVFVKSNFTSFLISVAIVINGGLINQYFNGGLSQAFGSIAGIGILLSLVLILNEESFLTTRSQKIGVTLLSIMAWVAGSASYLESTVVIAILLGVLIVILLFTNRLLVKRICQYLVLPGIISLAVMPVFFYSILSSVSYRIEANTGTGIGTGIWKLPTQNLGFFSTYSTFSEPESAFLTSLSVLTMFLILFVLLTSFRKKERLQKTLGSVLLSSLSTILVGFMLGYFSKNKSTYIYNKISTYTASFVIFALLILIYKLWGQLNSIIAIGLVATITASSAIYVENKFSSGRDYATILPTEFSNLLNDKDLTEYLEERNYILPYKPAYNFAGLLGAKYWISKAPNDFDLNIDSRINKELVLLCFIGENICNPKTPKIENEYTAKLTKYGIVEYASTLSTLEFSKLTIQQRYDYAFEVMGTPKGIIPDKYMGGNPYLQ